MEMHWTHSMNFFYFNKFIFNSINNFFISCCLLFVCFKMHLNAFKCILCIGKMVIIYWGKTRVFYSPACLLFACLLPFIHHTTLLIVAYRHIAIVLLFGWSPYTLYCWAELVYLCIICFHDWMCKCWKK